MELTSFLTLPRLPISRHSPLFLWQIHIFLVPRTLRKWTRGPSRRTAREPASSASRAEKKLDAQRWPLQWTKQWQDLQALVGTDSTISVVTEASWFETFATGQSEAHWLRVFR